MARLTAILKALAVAVRRDQKSLQSFATNNFFLISALLLREAGAFLYLIVGMVLLFPLSADPLQKIPAERLAVWPLTGRQRWTLRVLSPWLNPATWLLGAVAIFAVRRAITTGLMATIAGLLVIGFLFPFLPVSGRDGIWRLVPDLGIPLGQLIRKDLRQMLSMLDFYCALILSLASLAYRVFGAALPPDARMALTLLIVLALSSYAQCLFGLDGDGGMTRYRLFPLGGWQRLVSKDLAFLLVVAIVTLPVSMMTGFAASLAVLAVGHGPSVIEIRRRQTRWRFSTGGSFSVGLLQVLAMSLAGATTYKLGPLVLVPCVAVHAISVCWFGRKIDSA